MGPDGLQAESGSRSRTAPGASEPPSALFSPARYTTSGLMVRKPKTRKIPKRTAADRKKAPSRARAAAKHSRTKPAPATSAAKCAKKPSEAAQRPAQQPPANNAWPPVESRLSLFDPLDLFRRALMSQDMLFLSRQVTYHLAAAAGDLEVYADSDQIYLALTRLIEHIVRRAPRGSSIEIGLKPFALRSGPGIEIDISCQDRFLDHPDGQPLLTALLTEAVDPHSGVALSQCQETVRSQRGRLWADIPKPHQIIYHAILPSSPESAHHGGLESQAFKYDIFISNYASVRKHYGIRKSQSLVEQVELYVRSLVRYPMDMVMSVWDKGMITTIYETQLGAAESVASRISQRLGREEFRIGKKPVELSFRYHLAPLSRMTGVSDKAPEKRSS